NNTLYRSYIPLDVGHPVTVSIPARKVRGRLIADIHKEFNHAGVPKIREELSKHYYWPGMDRDIGTYISTCEICLQVKPNTSKSYKHTGSLTKSLTKPIERLYFDVTHPHSLL
ncbi:hypothetical protein FOZ63_011743, partial [Perkinsus olseni]